MVPILAHRLQEQAFGPLANPTRNRLKRLARGIGTTSDTLLSGPRLSPGTRLVRQWKSRIYVVNVENSGYEYDGIRYQSLSQIARLITGTRWSGPVFFGIKNKKSEKRKNI